MKSLIACICCFAAFSSVAVIAQEDPQPTPAAQENVAAEQPEGAAESVPPEQQAVDKAKEIAGEATEKAVEIAGKVDQDERAKEAAAGILQPIYRAAEVMGSQKFPAFYWVAFALMAAGTVSYALQLVLGKLLVLFRGSINLKEILSDLVGFLISVVGLVLTTQAATENSGFTQSPALVLSASAVGIIFGFMLFRWGTAQEVRAVSGQRTKK
jgi:hypothetical protein